MCHFNVPEQVNLILQTFKGTLISGKENDKRQTAKDFQRYLF